MVRKVIESFNIADYNNHIMFKEQYFDDKEWFVDLSNGQDIIDAIAA